MGKGITKSELCWVLVKLMGVVLLTWNLASLYEAIVAVWVMEEAFGGIAGQVPLWAPVKVILVTMLLPIGLGIYLLASGRIVHTILMSVPLTVQFEQEKVSKEELIPGINLAGEELKDFKAWIEKNPGLSKRDRADQVALFRDAQKSGEVDGN